MNDFRWAFRQLLKNPGFTAVAVLTLALGIGANTSIFSLLSAAMFPDMPYPDSHRLVRIHRTTPFSQTWENSQADFLDYRAQSRTFERMAAITWEGFNFAESDQPAERISAVLATADIFPVLGIQPALGRVFTFEEDQPGPDKVVILSHRFWMRCFAGDTNIVGRSARFHGENVTVIGVMPAEADCPPLLGCVDIWRPLAMTALERTDRGNQFLHVVGRLKSRVSFAQAQAEMSAIAARLAQDYPLYNTGAGVRLLPLAKSLQTDAGRRGTWLLLGLTSFVLLIACANLTNLQLARMTIRSREFAVRAALGASRGRLMRQLLTESLLISLLGGGLGLLLASWCNEFLSHWVAPGLEAPLDLPVIGFAMICSLVTVFAFGTAPAWLAARVDVNQQLKENVRGATISRPQHRLRNALIMGEVALALMLLSAAGANIQLLQRFARLDPGWRTDGLLTARVALPKTKYRSPPQRAAFFAQLEERLAALPGIESASLSSELPIFSFVHTWPVLIEDRPRPRPGEAPLVYCPIGGPGYFKTLGIGVRQGRAFTIADTHDGRAVAIINDAMARKFWPDDNPIGKRISVANLDDPQWREIVGVVNDVRFPANPFNPETLLQVYRPLAQDDVSEGVMIGLRTVARPGSITPALQRAVAELDPDLPVHGIATVPQIIERSLKGTHLIAGLLAAFGILGLVLAAIGIYGVTSYFMAQRTGEVGVRMALGAQKYDVWWLVLRQGLHLGAGGALLGMAGSFVVMRLVDLVIPAGSPLRDPVTIAGVPISNWVATVVAAVALVVVSLLACYLPARRATKIDPMQALRYE